MTRNPLPLHVLPVGARGDHRPYASCPCRPLGATELMGGALGRIILVHRNAPDARAVAGSPSASAPANPVQPGSRCVQVLEVP